ncbi:hypothetical protein PproGo58_22140 [Pseudomonas protegens]|nr:hypothetical protein PproGo58_22140 [Pseudomonas protegens]
MPITETISSCSADLPISLGRPVMEDEQQTESVANVLKLKRAMQISVKAIHFFMMQSLQTA